MGATPSTIDVGALLVPVAEEAPAGPSLQYDSSYDQIREARRADDGLSQGDWQRETKTADWGAVIDLASEALLRSKDLQIAAWLTEALTERHGFGGLRDGLTVLRGLLDGYWDALHPAAEDGDLDARANAFGFLAKTVSTALRRVALTHAPELGGEEFAWREYDEAMRLANLALKDPDAAAAADREGAITAEKFGIRADATPLSFYERIYADLADAMEHLSGLDASADARFGNDAPSLAGIKSALADARGVVESVLRRRGANMALAADAHSNADGAAADDDAGPELELREGAGVPARSTSPLEPRDRPDALRRLRAVAAFFRKTEPHSPVSYLVDRAARWGEMPLENWLKDVIKSDDVLGFVRETLGLARQGEDE